MKNLKRLLTIGLAVIFMFSLTSCRYLAEQASNRTFTIHFNANGGEGEMEKLFVDKGQDGYLPKCQFTKDGYECLAWSTSAEGTSLYGDISNLKFGLPSSVKDGDTVELYAVWTTPGFFFRVNGIGFLQAATIVKKYTGTAKDVIVPAFSNAHWDSSWGDCGPVWNIASGVFKNHTEIETVSNHPRDISSEEFYGCTSLKSMESRGGYVGNVGDRAFYNCSSLEGIVLDEDLCAEIGAEAFYNCTSIQKIVIPEGVEEIGKDAFYGWREGQTIEFTSHSENVFGEEWLNGCSANIIWAKE